MTWGNNDTQSQKPAIILQSASTTHQPICIPCHGIVGTSLWAPRTPIPGKAVKNEGGRPLTMALGKRKRVASFWDTPQSPQLSWENQNESPHNLLVLVKFLPKRSIAKLLLFLGVRCVPNQLNGETGVSVWNCRVIPRFQDVTPIFVGIFGWPTRRKLGRSCRWFVRIALRIKERDMTYKANPHGFVGQI